MRGLLSALAPHATSFGVLASSVGRLARRTSALAGADVSVAPEGDAERLVPGSVRLALVRCFQEGVRNALRHGAAKHVRVRLLLDDGAACLELEDDGAGLAAGASGGDGLGLVGTRARRGARRQLRSDKCFSRRDPATRPPAVGGEPCPLKPLPRAGGACDQY